MPAREGWWFVPFEPSPETVIRIGWISAALGFLIAIVSGVGEVLGWWDLLGEVGIAVGSLLGIVATFTTLSFTAGRDQVAALQEGMRTIGDTVGGLDETMGSVDERMGSVDERMGSVDERMGSVDVTTADNNRLLQDNNEILADAAVSLERIEGALVKADGDGGTSKLDVLQAELDRQTGVLDHQVEVLTAIRDAM